VRHRTPFGPDCLAVSCPGPRAHGAAPGSRAWSAERPIQIDPERLFHGIVVLRGLGRLELGPRKSADGIAYLYGLELRSVLD
jgi:hypothetical protein